MSTQIAKLEDVNYAALDAMIGSDIDGDPIRFNGKDGKYYRGFSDKQEVELGTLVRIAPTSVQDGFVK